MRPRLILAVTAAVICGACLCACSGGEADEVKPTGPAMTKATPDDPKLPPGKSPEQQIQDAQKGSGGEAQDGGGQDGK